MDLNKLPQLLNARARNSIDVDTDDPEALLRGLDAALLLGISDDTGDLLEDITRGDAYRFLSTETPVQNLSRPLEELGPRLTTLRDKIKTAINFPTGSTLYPDLPSYAGVPLPIAQGELSPDFKYQKGVPIRFKLYDLDHTARVPNSTERVPNQPEDQSLLPGAAEAIAAEQRETRELGAELEVLMERAVDEPMSASEKKALLRSIEKKQAEYKQRLNTVYAVVTNQLGVEYNIQAADGSFFDKEQAHLCAQYAVGLLYEQDAVIHAMEVATTKADKKPNTKLLDNIVDVILAEHPEAEFDFENSVMYGDSSGKKKGMPDGRMTYSDSDFLFTKEIGEKYIGPGKSIEYVDVSEWLGYKIHPHLERTLAWRLGEEMVADTVKKASEFAVLDDATAASIASQYGEDFDANTQLVLAMREPGAPDPQFTLVRADRAHHWKDGHKLQVIKEAVAYDESWTARGKVDMPDQSAATRGFVRPRFENVVSQDKYRYNDFGVYGGPGSQSSKAKKLSHAELREKISDYDSVTMLVGLPGGGKSTYITDNHDPSTLYCDGIFASESQRAEILEIAAEAGKPVHVVHIDVDKDTVRGRNAKRPSDRKISSVAINVAASQLSKEPLSMDEGFASITVVDGN